VSNHTLLHRLRRRADAVADPESAVMMRRLAEVAELDERLRELSLESPERRRLEDELARKSHAIIEDTAAPD
jgi:hypothetical protein